MAACVSSSDSAMPSGCAASAIPAWLDNQPDQAELRGGEIARHVGTRCCNHRRLRMGRGLPHRDDAFSSETFAAVRMNSDGSCA